MWNNLHPGSGIHVGRNVKCRLRNPRFSIQSRSAGKTIFQGIRLQLPMCVRLHPPADRDKRTKSSEIANPPVRKPSRAKDENVSSSHNFPRAWILDSESYYSCSFQSMCHWSGWNCSTGTRLNARYTDAQERCLGSSQEHLPLFVGKS